MVGVTPRRGGKPAQPVQGLIPLPRKFSNEGWRARSAYRRSVTIPEDRSVVVLGPGSGGRGPGGAGSPRAPHRRGGLPPPRSTTDPRQASSALALRRFREAALEDLGIGLQPCDEETGIHNHLPIGSSLVLAPCRHCLHQGPRPAACFLWAHRALPAADPVREQAFNH